MPSPISLVHGEVVVDHEALADILSRYARADAAQTLALAADVQVGRPWTESMTTHFHETARRVDAILHPSRTAYQHILGDPMDLSKDNPNPTVRQGFYSPRQAQVIFRSIDWANPRERSHHGPRIGSIYLTTTGEEVLVTEVRNTEHGPSLYKDAIRVGDVTAYVRQAGPEDAAKHGRVFEDPVLAAIEKMQAARAAR